VANGGHGARDVAPSLIRPRRKDWQPTLGEREGQQEVLRRVMAAIIDEKGQ